VDAIPPRRKENTIYSKYKNKKTIIDGIKFASKGEASRYQELKLLEKAGVIQNLELQPSYELQPKFKYNGKAERAITYKADFRYIENNTIVVEDVKGFETKDFLIKRKMFLRNYGDSVDFRIIKVGG
jgi:hypothetical protein